MLSVLSPAILYYQYTPAARRKRPRPRLYSTGRPLSRDEYTIYSTAKPGSIINRLPFFVAPTLGGRR